MAKRFAVRIERIPLNFSWEREEIKWEEYEENNAAQARMRCLEKQGAKVTIYEAE
jgi:hypothetical protein